MSKKKKDEEEESAAEMLTWLPLLSELSTGITSVSVATAGIPKTEVLPL